MRLRGLAGLPCGPSRGKVMQNLPAIALTAYEVGLQCEVQCEQDELQQDDDGE
jgi:hypothetical protein